MIEDDMPEEDRLLPHANPYMPKRCDHIYCDVYGYTGEVKGNRDRGAAVFCCKRCLNIQVRTFDSSIFKKSEDYGDEA